MVIVLNGDGKFLSHFSLKWKKICSFSSPTPSSSQWHLKGENKITRHKPRERRRGFSWKNVWSALVFPPLLALALLAESLPAFVWSQLTSWMCAGLPDSVSGVASASQSLCFSKLQKSSNSISTPCRKLSAQKSGLVEDTSSEVWRIVSAGKQTTGMCVGLN